MSTNNKQMLRDLNIEPTSDVLANILGQANDAYSQFLKELDEHGIELVWHYYNDGKAWLGKGLFKWTGAKGANNQTTVFWLSIWDGYFKVTFFIPEKARLGLLNLPLDEELKLKIADIREMEKLKYSPIVFDLFSDEMLSAVFIIADFKKSLK